MTAITGAVIARTIVARHIARSMIVTGAAVLVGGVIVPCVSRLRLRVDRKETRDLRCPNLTPAAAQRHSQDQNGRQKEAGWTHSVEHDVSVLLNDVTI